MKNVITDSVFAPVGQADIWLKPVAGGLNKYDVFVRTTGGWKSIYKDNAIKSVTDGLQKAINDLTKKVTDEVTRSSNKDSEHNTSLNALQTRCETLEQRITALEAQINA